VQQWGTSAGVNLPAPRTGGANFSANGTIYQVGGSDGKSAKSELYWAVPDATGNISDGWHHLDMTDLPAGGLVGGASVTSGATVLTMGGTTQGGVVSSTISANLAPIPPFFQLGLFGVVVPGLQIPGEIGQQLGYLFASGAAVTDFAILVVLGWVFNNKEKVRGWVDNRRHRRGRRTA
jgi:hypothetical protein